MEEARLVCPYDVNLVYKAMLEVLQVDLEARNIRTLSNGYSGLTSSWLSGSRGETVTATCEIVYGQLHLIVRSEFRIPWSVSSRNRKNVSRFVAGILARLPGAFDHALSDGHGNLRLVEVLGVEMQTAVDSNRSPGEPLYICLQGLGDEVIAVTSSRVLLVEKEPPTEWAPAIKVKSFDFSSITAVEFSCGSDHGTVQISAAGTWEQTFEPETAPYTFLIADNSENVVRFQVERRAQFQVAANRIRELVTAARQVQIPMPAAREDIADQIRKLAELRAAGIITEEEFQGKKRDLLARM